MFNYIIDPTTNQEYSLFSTSGKRLLKQFVKQFYGGMEPIVKLEPIESLVEISPSQQILYQSLLH